ncbi:MAG: hypothetical protein ABEI27_08025 [Halobellus sp.]|uniref:hypothetical protein n=1 Tax=Halobellus sp. TaxID=1979212 RepID=UPI0035D51FD9
MGRRRSRSRGSGDRSIWIVLGVVLLLVTAPVGLGLDTSTEAFTSLSADRGSSLNVADDTGGIFGLDVAPSVAAGTTDRLVTITNNAGQPIDFTVAASTGTVPNSHATLQPNESLLVSVDVACSANTDTVSFTVEGTAGDRFSGRMTRSTTVDTSNCRREPASITSGGALAGGSNGKGTFSLQNTGTASLTIVAINFTDTNSSATTISSPGDLTSNRSLEYSDGAFSFGTKLDLTTNQTLASGETVEVTVDKFRKQGRSPNVDMTGKYVEFVLSLSSGEQVTVRVTFPP